MLSKLGEGGAMVKQGERGGDGNKTKREGL
jgi:hypothetical protein